MNNYYEVTILPPIFDVAKRGVIASINFPISEFTLDFDSPIYPEIPDKDIIKGDELLALPGVNINLPDKVIIKIDEISLSDFNWKKVIIPVAIGVSFTKDMVKNGLSMSFSDQANRKLPKTVEVNPEAWHKPYLNKSELNNVHSPYQRPIFEEDGFGEADYWNMTYFTDLPKCSMSYDFWVTVRGVESERRLFETEFYVDGQKITQSNFAAMAEKYPALQE